MHFKNPILESVFENFKWTRNHTVELFEAARKHEILDYKLNSNNQFLFQSILFQFQCIITTTDAYRRKIINHKNKRYGILITQKNEIQNKDGIALTEMKPILQNQLKLLQDLLKTFDEKKTEKQIKKITTIINHEYLHQGQLILMFRSAGVELPKRFRTAWAL